MKKLFVLCAMVIALGFVATGCGGGAQKAEPAKKPDAESTPDDSKPADSK